MTKAEFIKKFSKIEETFEDEFRAEFNSPELIWEALKEQLLIHSVSKRYDEMTFKPPFRVGRKQGKAVLDANGLLVTFFNKSETQALLFCDYLNNVC